VAATPTPSDPKRSSGGAPCQRKPWKAGWLARPL